MKTTSLLKSNFYPWLIWGLATLIFLTEYLIRVSPTAMITELLTFFGTSKTGVSTFTAFFLYGYVAMQLPVGVMVDRFGARTTLAVSALICAGCTFLFASTDSLIIAQLSRAIMGVFAAFAFVGTLKLAGVFFPPHIFSILVGATQALGMIGAAMGASITGRLVLQQGWQQSLIYFALFLSCIAILVFLLVRNSPEATSTNDHPITQQKPLLQGLKVVLRDPQTWLISITAGLLFLPTGVFGEMWGSIYLQTTFKMDAQQAKDALSMIFIGWGIGGPFAGLLANRLGRRRVILYSAIAMMCIVPILLYADLSLPMIYVTTFLFGLFNTGLVACYTAVAERHAIEYAGVALAFSNGMSVIISGLLQPVVGLIMDYLSTPDSNIITSTEFIDSHCKIAMSVLILSSLVTIIMSYFIKETYIQKKVEKEQSGEMIFN